MLSQETSDHYISVFVMLMIVLLGEALLRCVAKTHSGYGGIKVQAFHSLLTVGADVTIRDAGGNTVLHTALSCHCPASAITHLVDLTNVDVNEKNCNEDTALHILLNKERKTVDKEVLRSLVRSGADVTVVGNSGQTPLHLLLARPEQECVEFMNIVQEYQDIMTLLNCIMTLGTAAEVKVFLKQCDRRRVRVPPELVVTAAGSRCDPCEKIKILKARHISVRTIFPNTGENILHRAVSSGNMPVLNMALEEPVLQIPDNNGDLPIHLAASSIGTAESLALLVRPDLKDVKNRVKATPLSLAVRSRNKDKVEMLLKCGCMPENSKNLKYVPFGELSILANSTTIAQSPQPLMFCLQMVEIFKKASMVQDLHKEECHAAANQMVSMAAELVNRSKEFPSDEVISYAINKQMKKFIACCTIQEHLMQSWYVSGNESVYGRLQFVLRVITYLFLFPLLAIRGLPRSVRAFVSMEGYQVKPYVQYTAFIVSYAIFLLVFVLQVVMVKSQPRCDHPEDGTGCNLNHLDWALFIYVIALDVECLSRVIKKLLDFSGFASWPCLLNVLSTLLLNIFFIVIVFGFYADLSVSRESKVIRVAFYTLSVGLACSFYRFLQMFKPHSVLGPIQISIEHMLVQTVGYVVYLIFQLIITASVITGIYGAEFQSVGSVGARRPRNSTKPRFAREDKHSFLMSTKHLYFSMFGLTDLNVFTTGRHGSPESVEETIVLILFGLWLTLFSIFFLSMVVAFVTNTYQSVQDNSEMETKFAKAVMIRQMSRAPPLPMPLNILHFILEILHSNCNTWNDSHYSTTRRGERNLDVADSAVQKRMMSIFLDREKQKNEDSSVTRKDMTGLYSQLNNLKSCIAMRPSLALSQSSGSDRSHYVSGLSLDLDTLEEAISPLAGSLARLTDAVQYMQMRVSSIERKFDNTVV
ncbi:transient receptor potential protein-like isoform X2 [Corticium candelabrum]|uniref:transient receptor potential protein-like isoform X2 n=1 Tax=Corticium candelabrum TaxID=121492 RepID=UPI002E275344|nr:transient receptor potential protein-like isoform X2 [Corticium candelabrum]XP_062505472.1 transient receptor potential protein-like isoform X2 [Corticium candelabrum]